MKHFACIILLLAACAEAETIDMGDGAVPSDGSTQDAHVDADEDSDLPDAAESDAHIDAGAPDADVPLPWPFFREGDECDLVTGEHINGLVSGDSQTCRREYLGGIGVPVLSDRFGAATFRTSGTMLENAANLCSAFEEEPDASKRCAQGRFCIPAPGTCHRACDPAAANPCPNTDLGNAPQECVSTDRFPQPYCRWADHL